MTKEQTRQLGIEFERRITTMMPQKEYIDKLDSDTIFSFLNQAQMLYVHTIYRGLDLIQSGTTTAAHVESVLQAMLRSQDLTKLITNSTVNDLYRNPILSTARSVVYDVPQDFYMYVRSVSKVSSTYAWRTDLSNRELPTASNIIPNMLTNQVDVWKLVETPHDSLRIMRYPAAVLSPYNNYTLTAKEYNDLTEEEKRRYDPITLRLNQPAPTLTIIHDQYTKIEGVNLLYYAEPKYFDVMTSTACELPYDCFNDLVELAVSLYTTYVAGQLNDNKERRKREKEQPKQEQ